MPLIDVEGKRIQFPDDMAPAEIQGAIEKEFYPDLVAKPQEYIDPIIPDTGTKEYATSEDIAREGAAIVGGLAAFPASGIAGLSGMAKEAVFGGKEKDILGAGMEAMKPVQEFPSKILKTPEFKLHFPFTGIFFHCFIEFINMLGKDAG